jgi:electron transfer flavoprotein alpha subunit
MAGLIIVEHDNQRINPLNLNILTAAHACSGEIDLCIVGHECAKIIAHAKKLPNIRQILIADAPVYQAQLPENMALLLAEVAHGYEYIIAGATTFGKNLLPRLAALLDVSMIGDVIKVINADTFVRPMSAGNVLATLTSHERIKIISIRASAFTAAIANASADAKIINLTNIIPNTLTQFVHEELTNSPRPELTAARIIVAGGRGLQSAAQFQLLIKLADKLGAAIGASRAAVDAGFAPNDYQIGQTGKVVAPDLYFAIGISGAIQHVAGMKESKVIVAINNDPEAAIFQIADYGLVADVFSALAELETELSQ